MLVPPSPPHNTHTYTHTHQVHELRGEAAPHGRKRHARLDVPLHDPDQPLQVAPHPFHVLVHRLLLVGDVCVCVCVCVCVRGGWSGGLVIDRSNTYTDVSDRAEKEKKKRDAHLEAAAEVGAVLLVLERDVRLEKRVGPQGPQEEEVGLVGPALACKCVFGDGWVHGWVGGGGYVSCGHDRFKL
jgi:hypothetical protein